MTAAATAATRRFTVVVKPVLTWLDIRWRYRRRKLTIDKFADQSYSYRR
jgi:hypothetical protein